MGFKVSLALCLCLAQGLCACELVANFDRGKIPQPSMDSGVRPPPPHPSEDDGGPDAALDGGADDGGIGVP